MIPKYTINLLSSLSRWLDARSETIWAKSFKHSGTMKHYAKSLNEIIEYLKEKHPQCNRCGGTDGPLLRELDFMDCHCVEREIVVNFANGSHQELALNSNHTKVSLLFPESDESLLATLLIKTGSHYESVHFNTNFGSSINMKASTINMLGFASLPSGGCQLNSAVYDLK